jgi:hypothetical protein
MAEFCGTMNEGRVDRDKKYIFKLTDFAFVHAMYLPPDVGNSFVSRMRTIAANMNGCIEIANIVQNYLDL